MTRRSGADMGWVAAPETLGPEFDAYGAELLRRIAGTVAIMLYEMELRPDGTYE